MTPGMPGSRADDGPVDASIRAAARRAAGAAGLAVAGMPLPRIIFCAAGRADADRHADLDRARPHGADFVFTMTKVPIESVALKLFTGIEKFEIMAVPFFILAGNFLTHGGVARKMIDFAAVAGRPFARRPGAGRHRRLRDVCAGLRIERGHRGRDRLDRAAGNGAARLSDAVRRRRHHRRRLARHPDAAVDSEGHLRDRHQYLDRRAVRRRPAAGNHC